MSPAQGRACPVRSNSFNTCHAFPLSNFYPQHSGTLTNNLILEGEIGNGRATCILLARQGAKVALVDHTAEWAAETKQMIDDEGGISEVIQADVTKEESCKAAVAKTVELFGSLSILVNVGMVQLIRNPGQRIERL